jgi:hypothetical protein
MLMDVSAAAVALRVAAFELIPLTGSKAVMLVVPTLKVVATPTLPAALEMVAIVGADDVQRTVAVMFCVVRSVKVPVAV